MRRLVKILLIVILVPLLLWLSIVVLNVSLPLTFLNKPMSAAASYALGRNVKFRGEITLAPRLSPTLEFTQVSVDNPQGQQGQLLQLGSVYLEIDLLSLLAQDIVVEELHAKHVLLELEVGENDVGNWLLDLPAELETDHEGDSEIAMGDNGEWQISADFHNVEFEDIRISYHDIPRNAELLIELNQLAGSLRWQEGIKLQGTGSYRHTPFQITLHGNSVRDLMQGKTGWQSNAEVTIAELGIFWQLNLLPDGHKSVLHFNGPSLATLSGLTDVPLADLGPYDISGVLDIAEDSYSLRDFQIRIGESDMTGSMTLRINNDIPKINIDLASTHLQINDFLTGAVDNNNVSEAPQAGDDELAQVNNTPRLVATEELLTSPMLNDMEIDLNLKFNEIFSGRDRLGGGYLQASAGDGRIAVHEWHINLAGGNIDMSGEMMATDPGYQVALKLDIENFDYGVIARRRDPESGMQGQFFLKVDLQSVAPRLQEAMSYGNGSLDFAVWPQSYKSGIFDLWAAGLISAAVSLYRSDSVVNCVVTRFDLNDGIMNERSLMIDTSKIRVLGDAVIDFKKRNFDIYLVPRAKKRQIISAATPVRLKGSFGDFKTKVSRSDAASSVIRSGVNIALMGIPALFQKTMKADGSADCRRAMTKDFQLNRKNGDSVNRDSEQ